MSYNFANNYLQKTNYSYSTYLETINCCNSNSYLNGNPGNTGKTGPTGAWGYDGHIGVIGPTGPKGVGCTGITGPVGPAATLDSNAFIISPDVSNLVTIDKTGPRSFNIDLVQIFTEDQKITVLGSVLNDILSKTKDGFFDPSS